MSDTERAAVAARLGPEAVRRATILRCPGPADLARYCDSTFTITPAVRLVSDALAWAFRTSSARLMISLPPQQGKTVLATNWFPLWCLQRDPDLRILGASYSLELIESHNRTTRNHVLTYGSGATDPLTGTPLPDKLGFTTARDKSAANSWAISGHKGGMHVAGVGGSLTGRQGGLAILDDVYSGLTDASSPAYRRRVWEWYTGTLLTRLGPTSSLVMVNTRFHPQDLMGELIRLDTEAVSRGENPIWRVINIPAVAGPGIPDSLNRPTSGPGRYLVSTRGHTPQQWEQRRAEVGAHAWGTTYQGDPKPAGSTVFQQEWWNHSRIHIEPPITSRMVSVDPAETGEGDEAGILALAMAADGRTIVTHDRSGLMRSDAWSRQATLLALELGARWVVYEAYVAGHTYRDTLRNAWTRVREQGLMLLTTRGDIGAACTRLIRDNRGPSAALTVTQLEAELREVAAIPADRRHRDILSPTRPPWQLIPHRGPKGHGKRQRAAGAVQAAETGRLVMLGEHSELEATSTSWLQTDNTSPDRMDALANGFNELTQRGSRSVTAAAPAADKAAGRAPDVPEAVAGMQRARSARRPGPYGRVRIGAPGSRR